VMDYYDIVDSGLIESTGSAKFEVAKIGLKLTYTISGRKKGKRRANENKIFRSSRKQAILCFFVFSYHIICTRQAC